MASLSAPFQRAERKPLPQQRAFIAGSSIHRAVTPETSRPLVAFCGSGFCLCCHQRAHRSGQPYQDRSINYGELTSEHISIPARGTLVLFTLLGPVCGPACSKRCNCIRLRSSVAKMATDWDWLGVCCEMQNGIDLLGHMIEHGLVRSLPSVRLAHDVPLPCGGTFASRQNGPDRRATGAQCGFPVSE